MDTNVSNRLRALPSVGGVAGDDRLVAAAAEIGREGLLAAVRNAVGALRSEITAGTLKQTAAPGAELLNPRAEIDADALAEMVIARVLADVRRTQHGGVRRAVNATGVILHTGLGRAALPQSALNAIASELTGYATVEIETESGKRGARDEYAAGLLTALLGCEAATPVNNNAAAVLLALAATARGKEVIVSRGQLVEIGGSFRVPDVMRESGCTLIEVGATNRTALRDYANAITERTAALMLVHTSNFRMIGFTAEVSVRELATLARERNLPLLYDIGSGALLPGLAPELRDEPDVLTALNDGADLVLFSADKILGGGQAGIAAGRASLVEKMRRHPLYRAFRTDKLSLCALEATLREYLNPETRLVNIPTLSMLRRPLSALREESEGLAQRLRLALPGLVAECRDDSSRLGSGSLPERNIPTRVVALRHSRLTPDELARGLRLHRPPVFTRIQDDLVLIDPRTLMAGDAGVIEAAVRGIGTAEGAECTKC